MRTKPYTRVPHTYLKWNQKPRSLRNVIVMKWIVTIILSLSGAGGVVAGWILIYHGEKRGALICWAVGAFFVILSAFILKWDPERPPKPKRNPIF